MKEQDLWAHGKRSPHWSRFAGRDPHCKGVFLWDCTPMERTHPGDVCDKLLPLGRTQVGEVHGGLVSVEETPQWRK